ncbi:hypothetical protein MIR68_004804 [Amoeboaphelidium protococcarum]|nr:hypothetical protein MIR68_004804 [Amoeboaphelidium protococcarum]KAI3653410.1 hypothetical protein MP228_001357 [Amoeboaphelidium protococcarum]
MSGTLNIIFIIAVLVSVIYGKSDVFRRLDVYEDVHSMPKYEMKMDEIISESILTADIEQQAIQQQEQQLRQQDQLGEMPQQLQQVSTSEKIVLQSPDGLKYRCVFPLLINDRDQSDVDNDDKQNQQLDEGSLLNKAVSAIEPLKKSCLISVDGWWTYEYCHLNYLRQYHQKLVPQLDANGQPIQQHQQQQQQGGGVQLQTVFATPQVVYDYYLGRYAAANPDRSINTNNVQLVRHPRTNARGVLFKISGGSMCEVIGKQRKVDVFFYCSTTGVRRFSSVKELSTCVYSLNIYVPELCQLTEFVPQDENVVNQINCQLVLSDDEYDQKLKTVEEESQKQQQQQQRVNEQNQKKASSKGNKQAIKGKQNMAQLSLQELLQKMLPEEFKKNVGGQNQGQDGQIKFLMKQFDSADFQSLFNGDGDGEEDSVSGELQQDGSHQTPSSPQDSGDGQDSGSEQSMEDILKEVFKIEL